MKNRFNKSEEIKLLQWENVSFRTIQSCCVLFFHKYININSEFFNLSYSSNSYYST